MTKALDDILREPAELLAVLDRVTADNGRVLDEAARMIAPGRPIYVVGIGSSWNAALAIVTLLRQHGHAAIAADASELLHFATVPENATVLVLSRSGKSVEIVRLLDTFERANLDIIAITNTPDSPLAQRAKVVIHLGAAFDHNVSFTMYSALALVGGLIVAKASGQDIADLAAALRRSLHEAQGGMPAWRKRIEGSDWLSPGAPAYLIARGASLASCHEARLLWEEVAKAPATAMPTGGFRHGSQEVVRPGIRIGLWLDARVLRQEDLRLVDDLRAAGARVMLIGSDLGTTDADLVFAVPATPPGWQFLVDILPAQLVSERLADLSGEDCDSFRFCSYVVEDESGITGRATAA